MTRFESGIFKQHLKDPLMESRSVTDIKQPLNKRTKQQKTTKKTIKPIEIEATILFVLKRVPRTFKDKPVNIKSKNEKQYTVNEIKEKYTDTEPELDTTIEEPDLKGFHNNEENTNTTVITKHTSPNHNTSPIHMKPYKSPDKSQDKSPDKSPMPVNDTVVFCEIPIVNTGSSRGQRGGDPCLPLGLMKTREITKQLNEWSGFTCAMDNKRCSDKILAIVTKTRKGSNQSILSLGQGGFNAVFPNEVFKDCAGPDKMLRISIRSFDPTTDTKVYNDIIKEIEYGLVAAHENIGPKIYKFGLMPDSKHRSTFYFYCVIERVIGCDISDLFRKTVTMSIPSTHTMTTRSKTSRSVGPSPKPVVDMCLKTEYAPDFENRMKAIIVKCIAKLKEVGNTCGFLMMDSKPPNMLTTKNGQTVYVIDYDSQFMKVDTGVDTKAMYGKINVILFLSHLYKFTVIGNHKSIYGGTNTNEIGIFVFQKLIEEYYASMNFKKIQNYMQYLYFANAEFANISHHYGYTDTHLLKIRYLVRYKELYFHDMIIGSQKTLMFVSKSAYDPILAREENGQIYWAYKDFENNVYMVNHVSKFDDSLEVYSLNDLYINAAGSAVFKDRETPEESNLAAIEYTKQKIVDFLDYIVTNFKSNNFEYAKPAGDVTIKYNNITPENFEGLKKMFTEFEPTKTDPEAKLYEIIDQIGKKDATNENTEIYKPISSILNDFAGKIIENISGNIEFQREKQTPYTKLIKQSNQIGNGDMFKQYIVDDSSTEAEAEAQNKLVEQFLKLKELKHLNICIDKRIAENKSLADAEQVAKQRLIAAKMLELAK
jgi:hypothetical protein